MKRLQLINHNTITLILLLFLSSNLFAQQSSVMYYMQNVPQSNMLNPATQPRCGFYLGLPGMSPLQINAENSAFDLKDVLWTDPESDSLIHPLDPRANFGDFLNNFSKVNYLSADLSIDIISYGFRSGNRYHTFDLTQRVLSRASYAGDLIKLYNGFKKDDEFDLSGMGLNILAFLEISTGVSHQLNDMLTVGYRGKVLFGEGNITSKRTELNLVTGDDLIARSKFEIYASLPGFELPKNDSTGNFDFEEGKFIWDDSTRNIAANISDISNAAFSNWGFAVDLGVHFTPIENLTVSASILDLGFIRWKDYAYNIWQDEEFIFSGFDYERDSNFVEIMADSVENAFKISGDKSPYFTFLPTKIYLGAKYDIIEQISVSALLRTEFYKGRLREQFNLTAHFYPLKMLSASFNYSIMNRTFNNFGAGLGLKAGPFNFYAITDNIPVFARDVSSGMIIPYEKTRNINLRLGFNLVFCCKGEKKKLKDLPLIL